MFIYNDKDIEVVKFDFQGGPVLQTPEDIMQLGIRFLHVSCPCIDNEINSR